MATTFFNVAIHHLMSRALFLADSPANVKRGLEHTPTLALARRGFADQEEIDAYVLARTGAANNGAWLLLDLHAAGLM